MSCVAAQVSLLFEKDPAFRVTDNWSATLGLTAELAQATAALSGGVAGVMQKADYFADKLGTTTGSGDAALPSLMKGVM